MTSEQIQTSEDLLARSLTMLSETVERYDLFADQMEMFNNPEVAEIFQWLSRKQSRRAETVSSLGKGLQLPHIEPWNYDWDDAISIELPDNAGAHYMMTPHHCLSFAIQVERSAATYFVQIAGRVDVPELRKLAKGFAAEAQSFAEELKQKRKQHPHPQKGWDEDFDPPLMND